MDVLDNPADPNEVELTEVELTEESINSVIYGNLNKYQDMSLLVYQETH